jgi:hypothetical protein
MRQPILFSGDPGLAVPEGSLRGRQNRRHRVWPHPARYQAPVADHPRRRVHAECADELLTGGEDRDKAILVQSAFDDTCELTGDTDVLDLLPVLVRPEIRDRPEGLR